MTITLLSCFAPRTIINTQASLDNGANFLNETQVHSEMILWEFKQTTSQEQAKTQQ